MPILKGKIAGTFYGRGERRRKMKDLGYNLSVENLKTLQKVYASHMPGDSRLTLALIRELLLFKEGNIKEEVRERD